MLGGRESNRRVLVEVEAIPPIEGDVVFHIVVIEPSVQSYRAKHQSPRRQHRAT